MDANELRGGVLAVAAAGRAVRPALIDEIVGDERGEQLEQRDRAGRGKVGVHEEQPTVVNLVRQRRWRPQRFSAQRIHS